MKLAKGFEEAIFIATATFEKFKAIFPLPTKKATMQHMMISQISAAFGNNYPQALLGKIDITFTSLPISTNCNYIVNCRLKTIYSQFSLYSIRLANSYDQRVAGGNIVMHWDKQEK